MIYSRAAFLTDEDMKEFHTLDGDGWLMSTFKKVCNNGNWINKTYSLPYFQGLKSASLDPTKYGSLLVLDSYYCYNAAITISIIQVNMYEKRTDYSPMLRDMDTLVKKYYKFVKSFQSDWHLESDIAIPSVDDAKIFEKLSGSHVDPTKNVTDYSNFERKEANEDEPIYALISLFTCYEFWPLLFGRFGNSVPDTNVYKNWIEGNQGGNSAKLLDSMVQKYWLDKGKKLDEIRVRKIFENCLFHEYKMFEEM